MQGADLRASERRASFREGADLPVWRMAILHTHSIDQMRARKSNIARGQAGAETNPGFALPESEHVVRLDPLRRAFLSLPAEQREAVHRMAIEGSSVAEAAAVPEIPAGTVTSCVGHARAALRLFEDGAAVKSLHTGPQTDKQAAGVADLFNAALDAQDAVSVRLSQSNVIGPVPQSAAEPSGRSGITRPDLPKGKSIRAAQAVATAEWPGRAMEIDSPDLGAIMLFSVLGSKDYPDAEVETASRDGRARAFFEHQQTAFSRLANSEPLGGLRRGAAELRLALN